MDIQCLDSSKLIHYYYLFEEKSKYSIKLGTIIKSGEYIIKYIITTFIFMVN